MPESSLTGLVLALVGGAIGLQAVVLLTAPSLWVRWLVAKPWQSFGVEVKIADEARLRRQARRLGIVQLALVGLGVYLYLSACGAKCQP